MSHDALPAVPLYEGATAVSAFDDADAILRDDGFVAVGDRLRAHFLGGTLPHLDGDAHRRMRRLHTKLFRRDALRHNELHVIAPAIERGLRDLRAATDADGVARVDLVPFLRALLCDMACRLIGLGDLEDPARRARFLDLSAWVITGISLDTSTQSPADRAADLEGALAAKTALWDEFVAPAVAERRAAAADHDADEALDLLGLLLADDPEVDDETVLRNCCMYISGSQGAVVQTTVRTLHNLDAWFAAHPHCADARHDVAFLRRAIDETLRLTPPQAILTRTAGHGTVLPSGDEVREGARIALELGTANRDAAIFGGHPDELDPERTPARAGMPVYGLSFGAGRHVCLGRRLALPGNEADDGSTEGIMLKMLRSFYAAGIAPDPDRPPVVGPNARSPFERYPVTFDALRP